LSIRKITKIVYECVCELPGCPGNGQPWISADDQIPKRCRWCGHYSWNGQDRRRKDQGFTFARVRQCAKCGGTKFIKNGQGAEVCAVCHPPKGAKIKLPKPRKVRAQDSF
jgi:hypothetical protein